MQNVQEKVITPSNKKALGIGLILIMLAGFAASLQDFFLPVALDAFSYDGGNTGLVFSQIFWGCAFVAIYSWLLLSKCQVECMVEIGTVDVAAAKGRRCRFVVCAGRQ